jgi:GPH family glycoside/pentoside/hexuronide:cation symporter
MAATSLPFKIKAGFTGGQIAGQVFRDIPSILLLFYLTKVIGLEPAIAGAAIFFPKVFFGVLSDLGVGMAADHFSARFPRTRWMLVASALAPAAMILIFQVPDGSSGLKIAYVFAAMSLYMFTFATMSVPYLAQYSDITSDPVERMVLMSWRHGFTGAGLLIGSAMAPSVIQALGGTRSAYGITACILSVICVTSLLIAHWAASRIPQRVRRAAPPASLRTLLAVFKVRRFRFLVSIFFAQEVAAGINAATIAFFLTYNLGRSDALAKLGIIALLAGGVVIFASPVWIYVASRIGNKWSYIIGAGAHGILMFCWGMSTPGTPIFFIYLVAAGFGLANSGWGIMALAMLGDIIADTARDTGEEKGGSFSAVWALTEKIGLALGATLLAGVMLSAFGFSSLVASHGGTQSSSALIGIRVAFSIVPGVINSGAALLFWWRWDASAAKSRLHMEPSL